MAFSQELFDHGIVKKPNKPHDKWWYSLKGEVKKKWGLGCVWQTKNGGIYGVYTNTERRGPEFIFLGWTETQALQRMNFVKSFL